MNLRPFLNNLLGIAGLTLLCSCATTTSTTSSTSTGVHEPFGRFTVIRYRKPVQVTQWISDPTLAADPEGAAMNIVRTMQQGDVNQWLSYWAPSDHPNLSDAQRQDLLQNWQSLQNGGIQLLGRTVAGMDVVVELSVAGQRLQLPLAKIDGTWRLTAMDPASEYLHWETSRNKTVTYIDPEAFGKHIKAVQSASVFALH